MSHLPRRVSAAIVALAVLVPAPAASARSWGGRAGASAVRHASAGARVPRGVGGVLGAAVLPDRLARAAATRATTPVVLADRFDRPDGLVTNSYATWNPDRADAVRSEVWEVTSGSLFVDHGTLWSGVPDDRKVDARSTTGTGSAVLRGHTRRDDLADVSVTARLRLDRLVTTTRTPAHDWDGVHLFLRRRSADHTYYVSVARRDGQVVIKKKVPTGGGTYHTLAVGSAPLPLGTWTTLSASARTLPDGAVRLVLVRDGRTLLDVTDRGTGGAPIASGAVGLRGDNAEIRLDDLLVTR